MAFMGIKTDKKVRHALFEILVLVGILVYLSYWSLPGLVGQYSFWRDEIFTAAFISGSWIELFRDWIGPDVHPPLYFITTKAWASTLGNSELSLRGLSFAFALATVALLWEDWRRNKRIQRLIALLFIACNPTFLYYSQEARSYTLILFLSSAVLLRVFEHRYAANVDDSQKSLSPLGTYMLCIALSLTHYFGFIFAFFILALDFWDKSISKHRLISVVAIGIICVWPAFHIGFLGNLGGVQQEKLANLTTTFTPVISTIEAYVYSSLYFVNSGIKPLNIIMIVICLGAISWLYFAKRQASNVPSRSQMECNYSILLISSVVGSLAFVEIFWPITTARNFIILLYPTSIIIGSTFEAGISEITQRRAILKVAGVISLASLTMILLLSSKISLNNLNLKVSHGIDYKSLALYLKANNLCNKGCFTLDYDPQSNNFGGRIDDYYFGELKLFAYKKKTSTGNNDFNSLPIIGSYKTKAEIKEFAQQFPKRRLITSCSNDIKPYQSTPFVLIDKDKQTSKDNYPCITNYK